MTTNTNSCEALQLAGTAVTTANSGGAAGRSWDDVEGAVTYDTTHTHTGALAMRVDMAGGTTSQVRWVDGADQATPDSWARIYAWFDAYPGATTNLIYVTNFGNSFIARGRIRADGTLDIVDSTGAILATTTAAIALGQLIRIEMHVTAGVTGTCELWLYNSADATAETEHISATGNMNTLYPGQWRFGGNTSSASTDVFWLDDIATSDTGKIGPKRVAQTWTVASNVSMTQVLTYPTTGNWLLAIVACRTSDGSAPVMSVGDPSRNWWMLLTTETVEAHGGHDATAMQVEVWACPAVQYAGWPMEAVYPQAPGVQNDVGVLLAAIVEVPMVNGYLSVDSVTVATADGATSLTLTAPTPQAGADCLFVAAAATDMAYGSYTTSGTGWAQLPDVVSSSGPALGLCSAWAEGVSGTAATFTLGTAQNWAGVIVGVRTAGAAPPQPNPNWPAVRFRVGLGYGLATPMSRVHWTDQTARLLSLTGDGRGIQPEAGLPQQSATDIVMDSRDGAYVARPAGAAAASAPGTPTTLLIADADATDIHPGDFFRLYNNTTAPDFADDVESGDLSAWPTVIGNAAASAAAAYSGSYGIRIDPGGGVASQVATSTTKWAQDTFPWALIRAKVRFNALPTSTSADVITFQNAPSRVDNLDIYYNQTTQTWWFDLAGASAYVDTGITPIVGHWYDIQALIYYGSSTYSAQLMIDGAVFPVLSSPGETPGTARSLHIGTSSTGKTYQFDIDEISVTVSTAQLSFGEGLGGLKEHTVFQVADLASAGGTTTVTFGRADGQPGGAAAATQTGDTYDGIPIDLYIPYQLLATIGGRTYVYASGWMRDIAIVYTDYKNARALILAADAWETLNADDPSILAGEILRRGPTHYWPLGDAAGAGAAANASGVSSAVLNQVASKYGAGANTVAGFGAATRDVAVVANITGNILGDPGTGWAQDGLTAAEMTQHGYALIGQGLSDLPPISGGVTIFGALITTNDQTNTILSASIDPTLVIARNADPAAGVGQGSIIKIAISRADLNAKITWWDANTHATTTVEASGAPQLTSALTWALVFDQTSWAFYLGGTLGASGSCNLVDAWSGIDIGGEADAFFNGHAFSGTHAHVAIFPRKLTADELGDLDSAAIDAVTRQGGHGELAYRLIRRKLDVTGWGGTRVLYEDYTAEPSGADLVYDYYSFLLGPEADPAGSVADITAAVSGYGNGLAFPDAAAQIQYRPLAATYRQTPRAILGEDEAAGEIPFQPGASPQFSPTYLYNKITVTNTSYSGTGGVTATSFVAADDASARRYSQRGLKPPETRWNLNGVAWDMAWWYLARYASPAQRIEKVTVEAATNPARWAFVLGVEVGDILIMKRRQLGTTVISVRCQVMQVAPAFSFGENNQVTGSVTLTLLAAPPLVTTMADPVYGVAGDTVMGA